MAPRLTTAGLALCGASVLGAVSTAVATDPTSLAAAAGRSAWMIPGGLSLGALACLVVGLRFARPGPIMAALALLGAAWLLGPGSSTWRSLTALAGGWLLAVAEMAYWSLDFQAAGTNSRSVYVRRAATTAGLVGSSVVLSLVPELNLFAAPTVGVELTVAGLLAVAALIAVAAALAWRLRSEEGSTDASADLKRSTS
jgi:hypothetical protein